MGAQPPLIPVPECVRWARAGRGVGSLPPWAALGSPGPDPLSQPGSSGLGQGRVRLRTPSSHTSAAGSTPIIIARIQVIMHGVDLPCPLAQGSPRSRLWAGTGPGPSGPGRAAGGRPATERSLRVRGRCPVPASPPRPHLGSSGIRRSQELRARGPQRPGPLHRQVRASAGPGVTSRSERWGHRCGGHRRLGLLPPSACQILPSEKCPRRPYSL